MLQIDENLLIIIGISGVTCGGKTTTATQLNNLLPNSKIFSQDDYFLAVDDPRHTWIPELNHVNFDIVSSLDMEKMCQDIHDYMKSNRLKQTKNVGKQEFKVNGMCGEDVLKNVRNRIVVSNIHILIIEGFSIFNYKPMIPLFDLKYYFTLTEEECFRRRITRVYEPPDCEGYFEKCVWPEHINQIEEVKNTVSDVTYFDQNCKNVAEQILLDISKCL